MVKMYWAGIPSSLPRRPAGAPADGPGYGPGSSSGWHSTASGSRIVSRAPYAGMR